MAWPFRGDGRRGWSQDAATQGARRCLPSVQSMDPGSKRHDEIYLSRKFNSHAPILCGVAVHKIRGKMLSDPCPTKSPPTGIVQLVITLPVVVQLARGMRTICACRDARLSCSRQYPKRPFCITDGAMNALTSEPQLDRAMEAIDGGRELELAVTASTENALAEAAAEPRLAPRVALLIMLVLSLLTWAGVIGLVHVLWPLVSSLHRIQ
jgi:hypothetical protein